LLVIQSKSSFRQQCGGTWKRWFFYGQDSWRVTSKLTIIMGYAEIYFPETVNAKGNGGFANIVDNGGLGGIRVGGFGKYSLRRYRQ
jgi:hypothetical protein